MTRLAHCSPEPGGGRNAGRAKLSATALDGMDVVEAHKGSSQSPKSRSLSPGHSPRVLKNSPLASLRKGTSTSPIPAFSGEGEADGEETSRRKFRYFGDDHEQQRTSAEQGQGGQSQKASSGAALLPPHIKCVTAIVHACFATCRATHACGTGGWLWLTL
jgi:hypothetical protein